MRNDPTSSKRCLQCPIRFTGPCGTLSDADLVNISCQVRKQTVQRRMVLYREKDPADLFTIIVSGVAKLKKQLADGRQHTVGVVSQGSILGRFDARPHSKMARAVTAMQVCHMPRVLFDSIRRQHPAFEDYVVRELFHELELDRDWILLLGRMTAEERVLSFFLRMAEIGGLDLTRQAIEQAPVTLDIYLTRSQIADFIGLTSETVSRVFTTLRKRNIIDIHSSHKIIILNFSHLRDALRSLPLSLPGADSRLAG